MTFDTDHYRLTPWTDILSLRLQKAEVVIAISGRDRQDARRDVRLDLRRRIQFHAVYTGLAIGRNRQRLIRAAKVHVLRIGQADVLLAAAADDRDDLLHRLLAAIALVVERYIVVVTLEINGDGLHLRRGPHVADTVD